MSKFKKFIKKFSQVMPNSDKLTKQRDERCIPIVYKIIKMTADYKGKIKPGMSQMEVRNEYDDLARNVLKLLLDKNVLVNDTSYIFSLIHQINDTVKDIVEQSLIVHMDKAESNLWGKDPAKITMQNLELVMRLNTKKE